MTGSGRSRAEPVAHRRTSAKRPWATRSSRLPEDLENVDHRQRRAVRVRAKRQQRSIRQVEIHRRAARPPVDRRKAHRVHPGLHGECLPPVAGLGPGSHRPKSPTSVPAPDASRPGWQAMRESSRKAGEIPLLNAAPRLPLSSASIVPEPHRTPAPGPDKLTSLHRAREEYGKDRHKRPVRDRFPGTRRVKGRPAAPEVRKSRKRPSATWSRTGPALSRRGTRSVRGGGACPRIPRLSEGYGPVGRVCAGSRRRHRGASRCSCRYLARGSKRGVQSGYGAAVACMVHPLFALPSVVAHRSSSA